MALRKRNIKNPFHEGQKYFEYLESNPNFKYQDVADEFRVSKARVSQMIALVNKLPKEILDYFQRKDKPKEVQSFTERKFRPLTLLESDEEKIKRFREMVNRAFKSLKT